MSLKNFHIFFISVSALMCLGMIFWGLWDFATYGQLLGLALAGVGAAGVAILIGYLKWFLKKYVKLLVVGMTALVGGIVFFQPSWVLACGVCYKDPDSLVAQATLTGVWFLLAVIVSLLGSIVLVARSWLKRARRLNISL